MTTITRAACLIGALLLMAEGGLTAQEPIFGSGPLPLATAGSRKIPLAKDGKSWEVPVSSAGVSRLVQITFGSEKDISASLICLSSVSSVRDRKWELVKDDCLLRITPGVGVASGDVELTVAAAALESSKIAGGLSEDLIAKANENPVRVTLTLDSGLTLWDQLRPSLLILGIILIAAFIGLFFFLKFRIKNPALDTRDPGSDRPQPQLTPSAEPLNQETAVEKTQKVHSKRLLDLDATIQSLETKIQEMAAQLILRLNEKGQQTDRRLAEINNDLSRRLNEVESGTAEVQENLSGHLAGQTSRLQDLFTDLPTLANLSVPARNIRESDLVRLEEQLISAARQSALPSAKLEALQAESSGLANAIQGFVPAAEKINKDQTQKRLARLFEGAKILNNEIAHLSQLASAQKHGFFVEMSLLEQNSLAKDVATALTREVMKLSDPEGYYLKRITALKAQVCVAAIDLADLDVDVERRNPGLQDALARLLQTLGMTQIDPHQNDKLQASEHQVVQFVRRVPGAMPGTIAHTMARGLQRGGEVIRKVSVLLYE